MEEFNISRSLGLVVVQTPSCLPFAEEVTATAEQLGIKVRVFAINKIECDPGNSGSILCNL